MKTIPTHWSITRTAVVLVVTSMAIVSHFIRSESIEEQA